MVEPLLPVGRFQLQRKRVELKRWTVAFFSSHRTLFTILWIVAFCSVFVWQRNSVLEPGLSVSGKTWSRRPVPKMRAFAFNLTDFGGVGDGVTVNTEAFETAVEAISKLWERGGGQLNVPTGKWLTAPFNLTSHMTLFLAEDAEILGIQDEKQWPLMPPLPSYGHGREHHGPRYGSLIHGQNLKDVVITGHNGTIIGQGQSWWKKYRQKLLDHTRGPLVQIMWSSDIVIANITLRDSPFWTFHPYDCKNVTVRNVTILAPIHGAPNTDGIDPDSCTDVVIEDCYISVGDDAIAIKSGWDQYGIAYGRPSRNILVRNLIVRSMVSAGISIGSEMSGGVSNVTVENLLVWSSRRAVRIKTAAGRGGYIKHITYRNLTFDNVRIGIIMKTDYNEHPDDDFNPKALPIVKDISFTGIRGQGVRVPVRIHGSEDIPIRNVTFRDMSVGLTYKKKHIFQCGFVQGRVIGTIFPAPCENLDIYNEEGQLVKRSVARNVTDVDYDI
ncbi:Pectin lyase-like superfamily protein isoform 2 [Hibiscus syriacus]|uniref:Pectin lyase-like superfamily protein isoform 2 n=1 Tax=Hibiscus syriacus TaxID=106335 RepID=A0A6A2XGY3_HIBSY|nr:probable polygalacturonase [Hibiscus syriacus]KAE8675053.1 Pectin lyase-like superfamily protein isoform 2 [Hibiscus syriacus]